MKKLFVGILVICFMVGITGVINADDCPYGMKDLKNNEKLKQWSDCVNNKCTPRKSRCQEDCIRNLGSTRCNKNCNKEWFDCRCDCYRKYKGSSTKPNYSEPNYKSPPRSNYRYTPPSAEQSAEKRRKIRERQRQQRGAAEYRAMKTRQGDYVGPPPTCFISTMMD